MSRTLYAGTLHLSTWSVRALLALWQSGLEVPVEIVPLYTGKPQPALETLAPTSLVPFLDWDGVKIWDSLAICEFLHEQAPGAGLWPADPMHRAVARSVAAEMHSGFQTLRGTCSMDIGAKHETPELTPALLKDIRRVTKLWAELPEASGGPFLFGGWCLADAFFAPVIARFESYGLPVEGAAKAYMKAVQEHPLMQRIVADAMKGRQD